MASGMGARGTVGRCYGYFADYKQCVVEWRSTKFTNEKLDNPNLEGCLKYREDYFECLHGRKERARIRAVMEEKYAQEYEAKHGHRPATTGEHH